MSASLKKAESIGPAVQRVCRAHAGTALACLRNAKEPEAVHEARKEIKRLRAVFRLARGGMARADFRKISKTMRLAAKPMAALRDAQVKRQALETLAGKNAKRKFPDLSAALETNFRQKRREFERHDLAAVAKFILKTVRRQLADMKLKPSGSAKMEQGLKNSHRRCQNAWMVAARKPTPENFHAWRQQVKNFWHQLQFFGPKGPARARAMMRKLETLAGELGNDHDLVLLQQFAEEHCGQTNETTGLNRLIDSRRKQLAAVIRNHGADLSAWTPREVGARFKPHSKGRRRGIDFRNVALEFSIHAPPATSIITGA